MSGKNNVPTGRTLLADEWNVDFDDTRGVLLDSWKAAVSSYALSDDQKAEAADYGNNKALTEYVLKEQYEARKVREHWKLTGLSIVLLLLRHLASFEGLILDYCDTFHDRESDNSDDVVVMESIDTSPLWHLSYLNIKFSIGSSQKFKPVTKWLNDLRRSIELLDSAIRQSSELHTIRENAVRMELLEVFEPLLTIMYESVVYLQRYTNEDEFVRNWSRLFETKVKENLSSIADTTKHLKEMSSNGRIDQLQPKTLFEVGMRDRILPLDGSEKAIFPLELVPQIHTEHFVGRHKDLAKIHDWLSTADVGRTHRYHIYGRRGVGKTQLALEYCRMHKNNYDAIFWIQCETKASLRQSFANIATKLELVVRDLEVSFSEALSRVLRWLRQTQKRWLLIYDNAERSNLLRGYWPTGGAGAMLLTSRSFYNFFDNDYRQGQTVEVLDEQEREDLLLTLLGTEWQAKHLGVGEMLSPLEQTAIDTLLKETGGLPIAIAQAANLIKDKTVNESQTVRSFLELFRENFSYLPRRKNSEKDALIKALDTVWSILFGTLSKNAKTILQCLSFLSPDKILVDLFMPSDQSMLSGCLEFCRSSSRRSESRPDQPLQSIYVQSEALRAAIEELSQKGLIRVNNRAITIHRTLQEAVIFENPEELQELFLATVNLLYDAFPQQVEGRPLQDSWVWCREWILHVLQLTVRYNKYKSEGTTDNAPLEGEAATELFANLLANAAWYLLETADYDECLNLVAVAKNALFDKNSLLFALLTNTAGVAYFEQNLLGQSRTAHETALEICSSLLPADHVQIVNVMSNLGNVESAEGNYTAALEYLEKVADMRANLGNEAAVQLALTYIQIGRAYSLQGRKDREAYQMFQRSESLLNRKGQRDKLFIGHVHYEFGNLQLKQGDLEQAATSYEKCRHFAQQQGAFLPLTGAANYKLGVVELAQSHYRKALTYFYKALDISETLNPVDLDGDSTRTQWRIAQALSEDPLGDRQEEALGMKQDAETRQRELADRLGISLPGPQDKQDPEKSFDMLVCGFFR